MHRFKCKDFLIQETPNSVIPGIPYEIGDFEFSFVGSKSFASLAFFISLKGHYRVSYDVPGIFGILLLNYLIP